MKKKNENLKVRIGVFLFMIGVIGVVFFAIQIGLYSWTNPDLTDRRILLDKLGEYIGVFASLLCSYVGFKIFTKEV